MSNENKHVEICDLVVGGSYLFQLSTWAPVNLKRVTIRYVGTKYIVMHNTDRDDEYCVTCNEVDCLESGRVPMFYIEGK